MKFTYLLLFAVLLLSFNTFAITEAQVKNYTTQIEASISASSFCGNGVCDANDGETIYNCNSDCKPIKFESAAKGTWFFKGALIAFGLIVVALIIKRTLVKKRR